MTTRAAGWTAARASAGRGRPGRNPDSCAEADLGLRDANGTTCAAAGKCTYTPDIYPTRANEEFCIATDLDACRDVVLDGRAETCLGAGACTYLPPGTDDFDLTELGVVDLAYAWGAGPPRPAEASHLFFHSIANKGSLPAMVNFSDCRVPIPEPEPIPCTTVLVPDRRLITVAVCGPDTASSPLPPLPHWPSLFSGRISYGRKSGRGDGNGHSASP